MLRISLLNKFVQFVSCFDFFDPPPLSFFSTKTGVAGLVITLGEAEDSQAKPIRTAAAALTDATI
jgi:hypothetical protein